MSNQEDSQKHFNSLYSDTCQTQLLDACISEDINNPSGSILYSPNLTYSEGTSRPQSNHLLNPYCQIPFSNSLSRVSTTTSNTNSFSNFNPYSSSFLQSQPSRDFFSESFNPYPIESSSYQYQIPNYPNLEINSFHNNYSCPAVDLGMQQDTPIANKKLNSVDREWTMQDDQILLDYVERYRNDWKKVFREFKKKNKNVTIAYLKNKYRFIKTTPFELRVRFSHQEDLLIAKYVNLLGKKWDEIACYFHNRTPIMIKNRYYSFIKKRNIMKELLWETQEKDPLLDPVASSITDQSSVRSHPSSLESVQTPNDEITDQYSANLGFESQFDDKTDLFEDRGTYNLDQVECPPTTESKLQTEVLEPELTNFQENLKIHEQLHSSFFFRDLFPELFTEAELQEKDEFIPFEFPSKDKKP